jgi:5-methylcytosine-specific restriction endonuclease McrA
MSPAAPRRRPVRRSGGQLTSGRWKKLRAQVIAEEPLCRLRLNKCTIRSDTADHIIPVKDRPDLKYVRANLRGSCQSCNMARGSRLLSEVRREQELIKPASPKPAAALEFFDISIPSERFSNLDLEGAE